MYTTTWEYNSAGLVNSMRYPSATPGDPGEVLTYQYKNQLSLSRVLSFPNAYVLDTYYDSSGRMLRRNQGDLGALIQTWNYYPWTQQGGRLSRLLGGNAGDPDGLMDFNYSYDSVGNVLSIADGRNGGTQTFTYDALDRLTTAQASGGMGNYALETYAYDSTTGNLASKAGMIYTYGDAAHKHAVTGLSNGNAYGYDLNGNMTTRQVNGQNYTLGYDAENRMVQVSKEAVPVASFGYDGDGQRILATEGVTTTVHIGSHFEYNLQKNEATRYYFAGSTRIAMRKGTAAAVFLLGDHLGSAGILADGSGNIITPGGLQLYKPWGESRGTSSISLTNYLYTGQQRLSFGLDFYNARWYDSALGRFAQADTIVPEASQGTQAWDRYAYTNNNPVRYSDPSGHCVLCVAVAVVSGVILGTTIYNNFIHQPSAPADVNISTVGDAMVAGYEHADHGTIVGEGLQSLQDDPSVQAAQRKMVQNIRQLPSYGQKSFNLVGNVIPEGSFTANGPSGNFVQAGLEWNQAFLMVHTGTLQATNVKVLADGTIMIIWKVDDKFDYHTAWKDHFRTGYRYWAYNGYAQIVSPIYHGVFGAETVPTNAYWNETFRPVNSIPK